MMPEPIFLIITALYLIQVAAFVYGVRKTKDRTFPDASPKVSVIIAARNEEQMLPLCLDAVMNQTYPGDQYEVIVANDSSTDRTASICDDFSSRFKNLKSFIAKEDPQLRGKTNALAQAIDKAQGEIIMITDADCIVPATWIEHTARRYGPGVGLVGGVTLQKASKAFEGMQSLDWGYILGIASSTASLGIPLGSIGNNLSFRKEAYQKVGGYRNLKFSVTEDYTLVQAILALKTWDYLYPIDERVLVLSQPCPTFKALLQQKHRWGTGGLDMKLFGFFIMIIGFSMHASLLWNLIWFGIPSTVTMMMAKCIADYALLWHVLSRLKRTNELKYFYWFQLYYGLYVLALPFLVFLGGKVSWKGRKY